MWPVLGTLTVVGLVLWLAAGFARLYELLRQAEYDARLDDRLAARYGGSLTWNDEDPAQLGGRRVSAPTPPERNGR